jgi:hypothetical protein
LSIGKGLPARFRLTSLVAFAGHGPLEPLYRARVQLDNPRRARDLGLRAARVDRLKAGEGEASVVSARQTRARERAAREREARVRRALELLPEAEATLARRAEKAEKGRISTTDCEARVMKMADGGFRPAYNVQIACDTVTRIIVGVDAVNSGSDRAQLPPMLDQLQERFQRLPNQLLADGGYSSQGSIKHAHTLGITFFAPVQKLRTNDESSPRRTACGSELATSAGASLRVLDGLAGPAASRVEHGVFPLLSPVVAARQAQ